VANIIQKKMFLLLVQITSIKYIYVIIEMHILAYTKLLSFSFHCVALTCFQVNPSDVIILEGILVFHDPRVRGLMNMKIFVDTGPLLFVFHI